MKFFKSKILIFSLTLCCLTACSAKKDITIDIPVSSSPYKANYQSIKKQLEDAGFTNITTQKIEDLTFGFLIKDGEVEKVTVSGQENFEQGDAIQKDASITIHYHTFKEERESKQNTDDKETLKKDDDTNKKSNSETKTQVKELENYNESSTLSETNDNDSNAEKVTDAKPQKTSSQTITKENNTDFAYVLSNFDEEKSKVFVEQYKGEIVEFDGHIFQIYHYKNYKTRYHIFVFEGDYVENQRYGNLPLMFKNVATTSEPFANLDSDVHEHQNIHIKAKIDGIDNQLGSIILEPIQITSR